MKELFYFTLYCNSSVANTYVGSRSNAKAYFTRWIRKNFPSYQDYDFTVCRYETLYDMIYSGNFVSRYKLVIVD